MIITKEILTAQREQLVKARDQMLSEINVLIGRIQMIDYMIGMADMEPPKEKQD